MRVILAADHRGYELKESLKLFLIERGYEVVDVGADGYTPQDDYVDFAVAAVKRMNLAKDKAILICGSGHGMEIVANRNKHVRAIVGFNEEVVRQGRQHEDANVLSLPADQLTVEQGEKAALLFLETMFLQEERHVRRLRKINEVEWV